MTSVLKSLNSSLHYCLSQSPDVYILGEDILDPYGGAFKIVKGLSTAFPERVYTTPVSEAGIVGLGVGMALRGLRPVVEIMFGDFLTLAADQLINHAAKFRWMSNNQARVPLVVRTPMGGYRGYGPTHSQSLEKHFLGAAGLRVIAINAMVLPESVLNFTILEEEDPVLCIEHKLLYPAPIFSPGNEFELKQLDQPYPWSILRIAGAPRSDMTLIAYGYTAELAREAMLKLAYERELFTELLVPTQLSPFELDPLYDSARKTGKVLAVEEGSMSLGWSAEIAAGLLENMGSSVKFARSAARDVPIPAAATLEREVLPQAEDIYAAALELVE